MDIFEKVLHARTNSELFTLGIRAQDEDQRWAIIQLLQGRCTSDVFEQAVKLCGSDSVQQRCFGVDVLAQSRVAKRDFHDEIVTLMIGLLEHEQNNDVLYSVNIALGHYHDARAVPAIIRHKNHPVADVRYSVVFGLLTHEYEDAIDALVELSADVDDGVRDWATFGLGTQIDVDQPAIREALFGRLNDTNDDVRGEALVGLARRKDERVIEPLINELLLIKERSTNDEYIGMLTVEAAELLSDARLCPALLQLRACFAPNIAWLEQALEACGCYDE